MANDKSYHSEYRTFGKCRVYLEATTGHPTPEMETLAWVASAGNYADPEVEDAEDPGINALGVILDNETGKMAVHLGWAGEGEAPDAATMKTRLLDSASKITEEVFDPNLVEVVVEAFPESPDKGKAGYSHGAYLQDKWQTKKKNQ